MYARSHRKLFWLIALLVCDVASERATNQVRDLAVNVTKYNYTTEHPFVIEAKGNGLSIEKPNMILFMPDQLRYDAVGIFGNEAIRTPNIDAFAAEGTRFTNMFQQAPTCSQSRNSMFTGQYPHVAGHRTLQNLLKPWEPNVFRSLRQAGYHVASISPRGDLFAMNATEISFNENGFLVEQTLPKFHNVPWKNDQNDIWNRLFYLGLRNETQAIDYDAVTIDGALKWLEYPPKEPWVLFIPLQFPHPPFTVEEPWFSMYNRSEMLIPVFKDEKTGYAPNFMTRLPDEQGSIRATSDQWQELIATYYGMGLWNETVTMFFTDHGEYLGDYGLVEKWPSGVSENLVHEPLIIGGAGLPRGKVYDELAEMVDLVPTMLQLGNAPETYQHYGLSLVDALLAMRKDTIIAHKEYAYTEGGFLIQDEPLLEQGPFPYDIKGALQHDDPSLVGMTLGIRNKNFTYVYRLYEPDELYDRKQDISERHNLAALPEYAKIRLEMRDVALRWFLATPGTIPWYKDERTPKVNLDSPYEQYKARVEAGDCKGYDCKDKLGNLQ